MKIGLLLLKLKLKENMIKILDVVKNENIIKFRYQTKRLYLEQEAKTKKDMDIEKTYIWNEFRPPLNLYTVDIPKMTKIDDKLIIKDISNGKMNSFSKFKDYEKLIILKLMQEIDDEIMTEKIVNSKFDPNPYGNLCCLQKIEPEYKYLSFFNKSIYPLIDLVRDYNKKHDLINYLLRSTKIFLKSDMPQQLKTFNRDIGKDYDSINEDDINYLFTHYVDEGYFQGYKRIYEDDICIYTGKSKYSINSQKYSKKTILISLTK